MSELPFAEWEANEMYQELMTLRKENKQYIKNLQRLEKEFFIQGTMLEKSVQENEQLKLLNEGYKNANQELCLYVNENIRLTKENEQLLERIAKTENMLEAYDGTAKMNVDLWERNEQLRQALLDASITKTCNDEINAINERLIIKLRQALRKCSPMTDVVESQIYEKIQLKCCAFCESIISTEHADDCEYIKLTGGNDNV